MENIEPRNAKNDVKEFVSSIITNKNNEVLVLKRLKTLRLDPGKYDLCSGHMKSNESPMQSVYRELLEEVGINHTDIKLMEHLGDIPTPHIKFPNTTTHIYNVVIDLEIDEINKRIEQTKDREMEYGLYLENIDELRNLQRQTSFFRTKYTEEMEEIYQLLEQKINDRKENQKNICEEK